jgi:putative flippase GtrA
VNTAVDFAVFFLALNMLGATTVTANIIAWFFAVQLSYVLNSRLTFREPLHHLNLRALAKFMLSGVAGLLFATVSLLVLSEFTHLMIAKLLSILIGLVFNFLLAKYFVFGKTAKDT